MKTMLALSLALALALAWFAVPTATGSPSANPDIGGPSAPPRKPAPAKATPAATSPSASPKASGGDFLGRHTMTGEVTEIDNSKGTFSLKTPEAGTLDLHAPPSALAGVKKGDRMAVEIAIKPVR